MNINFTNYRKEFMSKDTNKLYNKVLQYYDDLEEARNYIDDNEVLDDYNIRDSYKLSNFNFPNINTMRNKSKNAFNKISKTKTKIKLPVPKEFSDHYKDALYYKLKKKYTDYQIKNQLQIYLVKYDDMYGDLEYELLEG